MLDNMGIEDEEKQSGEVLLRRYIGALLYRSLKVRLRV